ncbi:MAG: hypothetical protein E7286_00125 [Lachnospiraceae bacterium]|nr:hypothetical protein [Lachnospiraceae bacterium]
MTKNLRWYGVIWRFKKLHVNRKYKDRLFRFLFKEKKDLLDLYNAVNRSNYDDPEVLEIMTMEDVIFLKMKNDLSFMVTDRLNLYEHQSTYSPNMPLRGLFYLARQYEGIIAKTQENLYGSKLVKIPTPEFVIFYNGTIEQQDRMELYLSDAFTEGRGSGCLECKATMFNINRGHNQELMERCRRLWEYAEFIAEVNDNLEKGYSLKRAITNAMSNCIERGVLADILLVNKAEVMGMLLTEYDEKKHMKAIRKEGYEDGLELGRMQGRVEGLEALIRKKIAKGKPLEVIAEEVEEDLETVKAIAQKC